MGVHKRRRWGRRREERMEDKEESPEEEVTRADEGKMLVLWRALSTQKSEKDEQRKNIFHFHCTVQGKVCSLIIDGRGCDVVSLSMIKKINLRTSTHPHLDKIQWLNQSKGLQVNSRCLVSFSIGKNYHNDLWFDAIPTNVCHVLLRRPWLFDRKVIHNGYLNTYSFTKDGKKSP